MNAVPDLGCLGEAELRHQLKGQLAQHSSVRWPDFDHVAKNGLTFLGVAVALLDLSQPPAEEGVKPVQLAVDALLGARFFLDKASEPERLLEASIHDEPAKLLQCARARPGEELVQFGLDFSGARVL